MGWAQRANRKRVTLRERTRAAIEPLKAKIAAREPLTDADHRLLAKCGPQTLTYLGYQPRVTLA